MKKNVLVIAGLAVLSTSAFASKARMEALGQGSTRGSEYISDSRNVFRNPAVLNQTKNYLITEWGTAAAAGDAVDAPRAEGGFFREMGSFNYGLYLGNNDAAQGRTGAVGQFLNQDNGLDLFLSGDMGVQWGARVHYAHSIDETTSAFEKKNTGLGLGLGVVAGELEGYADVTLSDKSTGAAAAGDEFKAKPGYLVGASYKWMGNTFFANYEATKTEITGTGTGAAAAGTTKTSNIVVGAGRIHEINPTARLFTDASLVLGTSEVAAGKTKTNKLPLTLGFEADATSWLVLRGSVAQNVILGETKNPAGKKTTKANSTTVAAGATLNFGKLKVDGLVGTSAASRAGTVSTAANTNQGVLTTDNLMTRVGVSYWF
ncbi:MAG: hypothetical protein ACXVLQ_04000 [Bacteriovorax sp.]